MVFHEQPGLPWTPEDFKLLEAYQILDNEICGQCGNPLWLCHSEDPNLQFDVRVSTCNATNAIDSWRANQEKRNKKVRPGENPFAVPYYLVPGENNRMDMSFEYDDLPTREDYYEALAEKTR